MKLSVAVVGAGIGGLATALTLARVGATVTVFERAERPTELGAGLMLQPNGLAVLAGLGLGPEIEALGRPITRMDIRSSTGSLIASQSVSDFGPDLDHCLALLRRSLHRVLMRAVLGSRGVSVRTGTPVLSAESEGAVRIDGPRGPEKVLVDLVVGADGVNSVVRQGADFGARVSDRNRTYARALVPRPGPQDFVEHWTRLGVCGAAEVAKGLTYVYCAAYRGAAARALASGDLPALREAWRATVPEIGDLLDGVRTFDDLIVSGVRRVQCRRWAVGRLVLLGDAAHAMAPNVGQGANSALVDAVTLADALTADAELPTALENYQRRRWAAVSRVQRTADTLAGLSELRARPAVAVRDLTFRTSAHFPSRLDRQVRSAQQTKPVELLAMTRGLTAEPG